jgi:plastocyanin
MMTPRSIAQVVGLAATLLLGASALVGCGLQPSSRVIEPVGPALSALSAPKVAAAAAAPLAEPVAAGTLEVRAANIAFEQRSLAVAAPGIYEVRIVNNDAVPHEVAFDDGTRLAAGPGQTATALVNIPSEGSAFVCVFPAHRDAGMVGQVSVTE